MGAGSSQYVSALIAQSFDKETFRRYRYQPRQRYFFSNVKAGLAPGTWWLDRDEQWLCLLLSISLVSFCHLSYSHYNTQRLYYAI